MIIPGELAIMMAIQTEEAGIEFYDALKKSFPSESAKYKLFEFLQKDEEKHRIIFKRLQSQVKVEKRRIVNFAEKEIENIKIIVKAKIFDEMEKAKECLFQEIDLSQILLCAIGIELDSVYFYEKIGEKILPSEKDIIKSIVKEEKSHVDKLISIRTELRFPKK